MMVDGAAMRRRDVRSSNEPTKATLSLSEQMPLILVFVRAAVQGREVDVQQCDGADARRARGEEHAHRARRGGDRQRLQVQRAAGGAGAFAGGSPCLPSSPSAGSPVRTDPQTVLGRGGARTNDDKRQESYKAIQQDSL